MGAFLAGLLLGILVRPLVVSSLARLSRLAIVRRLLACVTQWTSHVFWRGVEGLLNYLDELVASRREREADELGSPNLVSRTTRGA